MPEDEEYKSKTQLKREMHELQELGEHLAGLPDNIRMRLELPEALETAIVDYRRFDARGARKRQLQFIGRVMREIDAGEIELMLTRLQYQASTDQRNREALEQLGKGLLNDENVHLDKLIQRCPDLDIQQLRQLLRQCRKEQAGKDDTFNIYSAQSGQKLLAYLKTLEPEQSDTN